MKEKILNAMSESNAGFEYYGIRVDDGVDYEIGDCTADSRVWDNDEPTEDTLDGTSCIGFRFNASEAEVEKAVKMASVYYGNRIYLIAGDSMEYGEDDGEYIIRNAVVIAVLK